SFMLAWTVQPPGTRFDPPARISIPNMGDAPGAVVDIFSFDHDLGEFVPIGTATVSDDGTRVTSNRGSGVVKAGWHGCVPPPLDPTDICQPSSCKKCNAEGELEPLCEEACEVCDDGTCTPRGFESLTALGFGSDAEDSEDTIVATVDQTIDFSRRADENCRKEEYEWDFGDGNTGSGKTTTHAFEEPGVYTVELTGSCLGCDGPEETDTIDVRVIELDLEIRELAEEGEEEPNEESPGAFVVVNDDDDNDNDTDDLDESNPVEDEDDLVEAKINFDRETERGTLRLEAKKGGSSLLVWTSEDKAEQLELPKTWELGGGGGDGSSAEEVPEAVWVEAVAGSGELRDIELVLSFEDELLDEPVEDKVMLTAIDLEFRVSPDETRQQLGTELVDPIGIGASVFFADFNDPEKLVPVADGTTVAWEVLEGGGSIEGQVETEDGFAPAIANLPQAIGSVHRLRATVEKIKLPEEYDGVEAETNIRRDTEEIEVIAGLPETIELSSSQGAYTRDGVSEVEISALVLDVTGEPVEDGTPIDWLIDGDAELVSTEPTTSGGRATAVIVAAPSFDVSHFVTAQALDASDSTAVSVEPVTVSLSAPSTILDKAFGDAASLSLTTSAGDGAEVTWAVANGTLVGSSATTQGGQATAVVSSADSALGPIRVIATVAGEVVRWEGTVVSSAPTSILTGAKVLVDDPNSPLATTGVTLKNGKNLGLPVSTVSTVRGPEDGFAEVSVGGSVLAEAFRFDQAVEGAVPGEVGLRDIDLGSAFLDTTDSYAGDASLFTNGALPLTVSGPSVVFGQQELLTTMWIRPQVLSPSVLASQGENWAIELQADGRIRADIQGVTLTSSNSVLPDTWTQVSLYANTTGLRLHVGGESVAAISAFASFASADPVELADGFIGHLDELSFHSTAGGLEFVVLEGLDATGGIALDGSGEASVTVRSRGTTLGFFEVESVVLRVATAETQDALRSGARLEKIDLSLAIDVIRITSFESLVDLIDLLDAATGGDPDEIQDWVAVLVGGYFAVADIGALIREGLKLVGALDGDPSAFVALLSVVGIFTAANPLVDGIISALRPIIREVAGTALERFLFETIQEFVARGFRFLDEQLNFLRGLTTIPRAAVVRLARVFSIENWRTLLRVHRNLGDDVFEMAVRSVDEIEGGAEALGGILRYMDEIGDSTEFFKKARDAGRLTPMVTQMTSLVAKWGVSPELIVRVVENCKNICNDTQYPVWQMIDDLDLVANNGAGDGIASFIGRLRTGSQTADPNFAGRALGNRYELEVAAACVRRDGGTVRFLAFMVDTQAGRTDVDVLWEFGAESVLYQAKRGDPGTVKKAEEFITRAIAFLKQEGLDMTVIQYVVPDPERIGPSLRNKINELLNPFDDLPNPIVREVSAPGPAGQ
ncbi:MAG: PKD domain-containing protein, partial [Acidobacteriota bacterium]